MAKALLRGELKAIIMTACSRFELSDGPEARVGGLFVRRGCKTIGADGLIAVDLFRIRLVDRPGTNVLRLYAGRISDLVFEAQAPFRF